MDNIEMYFEVVILEYVDCISLALNGDQSINGRIILKCILK